jgi:hypothetical protein
MSKKVYRTWGYYEEHFRCRLLCIKTLVFRPGMKLSKQRHKHRYEIWLLTSGVGVVYGDDRVTWCQKRIIGDWCSFMKRLLFIGKNKAHQFGACSGYEARVLEIQFGTDVREDDIERL